MSNREQPHCPFLNRSDARCGTHFSLDRLGTAFDHCFGCYADCPTYAEMLGERLERRQATTMAYPVSYAVAPHVIQVRLPAGHHGHAA